MTEDGKKEWNPLEEKVPEGLGLFERADKLTNALVYGANKEIWDVEFKQSVFGELSAAGRTSQAGRESFNEYLQSKWNNNYPSANVLIGMGYFDAYQTQVERTNSRDWSSTEIVEEYSFRLTQKAYNLFDHLSQAKRVFISYRHIESSALALLIEARLLNKDRRTRIYIDRSIKAGDAWHPKLVEELDNSDVVICLLKRTTIKKSNFVRKEILFAMENNKQLIPVCHGSYKLPDNNDYGDSEINAFVRRLNEIQGIKVEQRESAEQYEIALLKLFIALGYSTL